ncbi:hypothetical protein EVAR_87465_1 [Eumeta japonica]|uniref:Uncharacterized protein n=1 Tax=Eumeta variegata TaxID=151549 RepID=A0A4C1VX05_EUMVA|nr:hypothetical protein EVAR_87465_1 [Eumeta japonica]
MRLRSMIHKYESLDYLLPHRISYLADDSHSYRRNATSTTAAGGRRRVASSLVSKCLPKSLTRALRPPSPGRVAQRLLHVVKFFYNSSFSGATRL